MSVQVADLVASLKGEDAGFTAMMATASGNVLKLGGSTKTALGSVDLLGAGLAALAIGGIAATVKAASDFNTIITQVQNNTTMTAAQVAIMKQAIITLATESNAPIEQLADGFMHISNLGFNAKDAVKILTAAMESATSTGGNTADVANTLALQMHEFGLKASEAALAMDILHLSAALGNSTLEDFVSNTSKSVSMAANLKLPIQDVDAALAALNRHMDLAQANTALAGMLSKIVDPSAAATKELQALGKASGIDLVGDFSEAGLKAKGLQGVLDDLKAATKGNASEIFKLIPAMRGGQAAMVLTGTGADDFKTDLQKLNDVIAGKLTPTSDAFKRSQQTLGEKIGQLKNIFHALAIEMGNVLLPVVTNVAKGLVPIAQAVLDFTDSHKGLVDQLAKGMAAIATFFTGLTTIKLSLKAAQLAVGPLLDVIGTISAPLLVVAAAVATFALAWKNDWGGIQEKAQAAWTIVKPIFAAIQTAVGNLSDAFQKGGVSNVFKNLSVSLAPVGDAFKDAGGQIATAVSKIDWSAAIKSLGTALGTFFGAIGIWVSAHKAEIATDVGKVGDALKTALGSLGSGVASIDWGKFFAGVGEATGPLRAQLAKWGQEFSNWIGPATTTFEKNWPFLLNHVLDEISSAAGPMLAKLATWAAQFVAWIAPQVPGIVKKLALISVAITTFILETATTIGLKVTEWAVQMTVWVAEHAVPKLIAAWPKFVDALNDQITSTAAAIGSAVAKWAPKLAEWVDNGMAQLKPKIQAITSTIVGWLGDAPSVLLKPGQDLINGLVNGITTNVNGLLHTNVQRITTDVVNWIGNAGSVLYNAGAQIIQGMINGMGSMAGALMAYVKNAIVQGVKNAVTTGFGIFSPSREFHGYGQNIVQGLIDGMGSKQSGLQSAVSSMMNTVRGAGGATASGGAGLTSAAAGLQSGAGGMPVNLQLVLDGKQLTTTVLTNMKQGQYYRVGLV